MNTTIVAVATPPGRGALSIIRLSGADALKIADNIWRGRRLSECNSHTIHLGDIVDRDGSVLDNALASVFKAPNTFTGEDIIEFSIHASSWIQKEVMNALIHAGAVPAAPGEFSQRAFLNKRLDLAQAEGISDLIASSSRAAHKLAMQQMKGVYSEHINVLRDRMIQFASLLELELDFSEEDVEFADRENLKALCGEIDNFICKLADSYRAGKVFKEGVPVAIIGVPNAGKSTLLNYILEDDRAIVSSIPGTTRDTIEETVEINGILFRMIDTAGLRDANDEIEKEGIRLAHKAIGKSAITLWLIDPSQNLESQLETYGKIKESAAVDTAIIPVIGKSDLLKSEDMQKMTEEVRNKTREEVKIISVKGNIGVEELKEYMAERVNSEFTPDTEIIITNARHYASLIAARESIKRAAEGIEGGISADFIAQDVREAIHHLTNITGAITTDTLLTSIFSSFCIGK